MNDNKRRILINQIKVKKQELKSAEDALKFWKEYKNLQNASLFEKHYERQVEDCEKFLKVLTNRLEGGDI
jgi:hypothetical protein